MDDIFQNSFSQNTKIFPNSKLKQILELPSNANWRLSSAIQTPQILGSRMNFNYSKENQEMVQISIAFTEIQILFEEWHMTYLFFIPYHSAMVTCSVVSLCWVLERRKFLFLASKLYHATKKLFILLSLTKNIERYMYY